MSNVVEVVNSRSVINGMKGLFFLMIFKYYDFVKFFSIDYMYGVLFGVIKVLINFWMSGSNSKERFLISFNILIIDDRFKRIKLLFYIIRVFRIILSYIKYWKVLELRIWFFFYFFLILCDIFDEKYFYYFVFFVEGIYFLCIDCIIFEDLEKSKILFLYFVYMFSLMYGERYVILNMYFFLYLFECVEDLGLLWVYLCFLYENVNGLFIEFFYGI